jgi:hypothetical protein
VLDLHVETVVKAVRLDLAESALHARASSRLGAAWISILVT